MQDAERWQEPASDVTNGLAGAPNALPLPLVTKQPVPLVSRATPYHPTRRPSIAAILICDDLGSGGEWHRVRDDLCVIGRTDGQLCIPHDPAISGKHLQLRRTDSGEWWLEDLGSRNGTFVRVTNALLAQGQQFLIGNRLFRFESQSSDSAAAQPIDMAAGATTDWSSPQLAAKPTATLVEIPPQKPQGGRKFRVAKSVIRLGAGATQCDVAITHDPFACPLHGQLAFHPAEGWWLVDLGSVNGCWLRVDKYPVRGQVDVQIGEQRLRIQLGGSDSVRETIV